MQGKIITAVIFIDHSVVETVKDQNTHKQKKTLQWVTQGEGHMDKLNMI